MILERHNLMPALSQFIDIFSKILERSHKSDKLCRLRIVILCKLEKACEIENHERNCLTVCCLVI